MNSLVIISRKGRWVYLPYWKYRQSNRVIKDCHVAKEWGPGVTLTDVFCEWVLDFWNMPSWQTRTREEGGSSILNGPWNTTQILLRLIPKCRRKNYLKISISHSVGSRCHWLTDIYVAFLGDLLQWLQAVMQAGRRKLKIQEKWSRESFQIHMKLPSTGGPVKMDGH